VLATLVAHGGRYNRAARNRASERWAVANVEQHYDLVLSDVYSWMYGGFDAALARYTEFFASRGIEPAGSGRAIDLGAGCGFQSIPLARLGFAVTAIDLDRKLLDELRAHAGDAAIAIVRGDLGDFDRHAQLPGELVVCMVDTLVHLETKAAVVALFDKVWRALEARGRFVITYRDLSREATELDRFIPVRSDDETILTCFLEYETETVKIHDLVYRKREGRWVLGKSYYRKLRLSKAWVEGELERAGFSRIESGEDRGFVTIVATK
jgi:protein-L-isoaspartate O-methyltransferase